MRLRNSDQPLVRPGVTLVEILVVIGIISMLATLSFYGFLASKRFADGIVSLADDARNKIGTRPGGKGSTGGTVTPGTPRPTYVPGVYFVDFTAIVRNPNGEAHRLASLAGGQVSKVYTAGIYGFVLKARSSALTRIATDPAVLKIEPMQYIYPAVVPNNIKRVFCNGMAPQQDTALSNTIWGVPTNLYGMYRNTNVQGGVTGRITFSGSTSATISVAVMDTGIDKTHPDLFVALERDFTNGGVNNNPMDAQGHGTHIAGVIGATDQSAGTGVVGVYPGAPLINLKVMNANANDVFGGTAQDVYDALTYVSANASFIRVCLMAFETVAPDPKMDALVNMAANSGVLMVAAAGNAGVNINGVSPARSGQAIVVGAMVDTNGLCGVSAGAPDETFAGYSNIGALDFVAPGGVAGTVASHIRSTTANPLNRYSTNLENIGGATATNAVGTSFAAAHVAGLLAFVLDPQTQVGYVIGNAVPTFRYQMYDKATAVASLRNLTQTNAQFPMINPLTNSAWLITGTRPRVITLYTKRFNTDAVGGFLVPNFYQNPGVAPSVLGTFPG